MINGLLMLLHIFSNQFQHIALDLHILVVVKQLWKYPDSTRSASSHLIVFIVIILLLIIIICIVIIFVPGLVIVIIAIIVTLNPLENTRKSNDATKFHDSYCLHLHCLLSLFLHDYVIDPLENPRKGKSENVRWSRHSFQPISHSLENHIHSHHHHHHHRC